MSRPKFGSIYQRRKKLPDGTVQILPKWWIKYTRNGQVFRESSRSDNRSEAGLLLKKRLGQIADGRFGGLTPERVRMAALFEAVVEDYVQNGKRTLLDVKVRLRRHLMPAFGDLRAAEFSSTHIKRYIAKRRQESAANATINRELAIVSRAFRLAAAQDPPAVVRIPHIPKLPEENVREGFLDLEGYHKLLAELPKRLRLLFVVGYHTGVRSGELKKIRIEQVDLKAKQIHVSRRTTKNKDAHTLPIYGDMGPWIEMALTERDAEFPECPWLFFDERGRQVGTFRKAWVSACKRAGVPGLLFHDLRRSAAMNMDRAGVPRRVIMQITGHKTEAMFLRYRIVNHQDLRDASHRMEEYLSQQPPSLGTPLGTPGQENRQGWETAAHKSLN